MQFIPLRYGCIEANSDWLLGKKSVWRISVLFVRVYVKAWFFDNSAPYTPAQDLLLFKQLDTYRIYNENMSRVAVKMFLNHLGYLSEELVALAFLDQHITLDTIEKLLWQNQEQPPKRALVDPCDIHNKFLYDFVTYNTNRFSRSLEYQPLF